MPKRTDIQSILIIGAGPIVIGQGGEFDYSGAQAVKALKEEGYRIILVNSNPATIMTDPNLADSTYIEPIRWEVVAKIIEKERPDALLPTMGGQTALNCALDLAYHGVLEKYNVELIGANKEAIDKAEDREKFSQAMKKIGLAMPASFLAKTLEEAIEFQKQIHFPTIIRPSYTLGGTGGGIAYNYEEFIELCKGGFDASPTHELLIEQSVLGWKEYEMEVVRDKNDNCIIVCSIENLDPMGIHTGDSITVAPAQTLTDKEYQYMRKASIAVLREIGVETGGSNVQFAVNPDNGDVMVIEMNPRVSRSSALASKATGFPIAKIAAKLAVGYTLDELANDITGGMIPASFEPTIDYVVTKMPRFNFEKFPGSNKTLTTQMKSVGEVMAIGRTFQESFQKALRSLEIGIYGLESQLDFNLPSELLKETVLQHLQFASADRILYVADAFRLDMSVAEVFAKTKIDKWFLTQIQELVYLELNLAHKNLDDITASELKILKQKGFSDPRLAYLLKTTESVIRAKRHDWGIRPVYKRVDSCSGEFPTTTSYLYSTYETFCESQPSTRPKIMVLGGGPNRIGQGIEFDYCCVHAALAFREAGYETIMVNCNPETVSTDYDISDRLYFEPLTLEDVIEIQHIENAKGLVVQFGGQTPLKLAKKLDELNIPILGTSVQSIDAAEDREQFKALVTELGLVQPKNEIVRSTEEALSAAQKIGYPIIVRPSYVLGGRAMEIVHNDQELIHYVNYAISALGEEFSKAPLLLDRYLNQAIEVDIDAVCDGESVLIGAVMEHIEEAGVHSGDSTCSLPPFSLPISVQQELKNQMVKLALKLNVKGLMNAQFAYQDNQIYLLEVNPRAARTAPFVSKTLGICLPKIAALCMVGITLKEQNMLQERVPGFYSVKKSVFPYAKFPGADPLPGPEMRSTGEVMGVGAGFGEAFAKSDLATQNRIPASGQVFISVKDSDKPMVAPIARRLFELGYQLVATNGTYAVLAEAAIPCTIVQKVTEGRPHIVDLIKSDKIAFVINTTEGKQAIADSYSIRRSAVERKINYVTTLSGAKATVFALSETNELAVTSLQELHKKVVYQ
jgi:carbamoyl-phosphate synthase large subunit